MKTVTLVLEDGQSTSAVVALVMSALQGAGIPARVEDGANLAQFTDREIEVAARDRGLGAVAGDLTP